MFNALKCDREAVLVPDLSVPRELESRAVSFTKTLGRVLSRPSIARMPALIVRIGLGEMADELLLASTRVRPERLLHSSYELRHDALEDALRHMLGRTT